jgi:uncharacterized membrane protein
MNPINNAPVKNDSHAATPGDIDVSTSVEINVPAHEVFEFWRALENFPKFMGHVKEVRAVADNRYLWRVAGPVGTEVSWEADVVNLVEDQRISWQSVGDATVKNSGSVEFSPTTTGGTHLKVQLSYSPPLGILGHAVATLLGENPKQQMDQDLQSCKALLEKGYTLADGNVATQASVRHNEKDTHRAH